MRETIIKFLDEMIEQAGKIRPSVDGVSQERKDTLLEFLWILRNSEEHMKNFISVATSLYAIHPEVFMMGLLSAAIKHRMANPDE